MPDVFTHVALGALNPEELRGGLAIVIDLLRASTTMTHAIQNGAAAVAPVESIERAREVAAGMAPGSFLLGGERRGVRIAGFDLGNSPLEYTSDRVRGKTIVFTTTNGTVALWRADAAARVVVGCFANLSAVCGVAAMSGLDVHLVCAGIHGGACREDSMCAGALAEGLAARGLRVRGDWELWKGARGSLVEALRNSEGGRNLISAGLEADIPVCAAVDTCGVVPEWERAERVVRG